MILLRSVVKQARVRMAHSSRSAHSLIVSLRARVFLSLRQCEIELYDNQNDDGLQPPTTPKPYGRSITLFSKPQAKLNWRRNPHPIRGAHDDRVSQ